MSQVILSEGSAPSTPSSGKVSVYPKTTGLFFKNDAGLESLLGNGCRVVELDETITGLAAVSTDISQDIPDGSLLLCVQANIETLVVAGGTSVKVGIGPTSDPDKYGITSALTKNLKIDTIPPYAVLSGAEDVQINMCATGGGIGDTVASSGDVRVRIVFAIPTSLEDAT